MLIRSYGYSAIHIIYYIGMMNDFRLNYVLVYKYTIQHIIIIHIM